MEKIILEQEIRVLCVKAATFPDDVLNAHQKLHYILPQGSKRNYFGISAPDITGKISYKAAAEITDQIVDSQLGLEVFTIRKGKYYSVVIYDFMNCIYKIGSTFQEIISRKDIDPEGYCIEWYFNDRDVRCMVKINEKE